MMDKSELDKRQRQEKYLQAEIARLELEIEEKHAAIKELKKQLESTFTPIEHLDLSIRPYNALKRHGIFAVEVLAHFAFYQPEYLKGIRNLGESSRKEVLRQLAAYGYTKPIFEPKAHNHA